MKRRTKMDEWKIARQGRRWMHIEPTIVRGPEGRIGGVKWLFGADDRE